MLENTIIRILGIYIGIASIILTVMSAYYLFRSRLYSRKTKDDINKTIDKINMIETTTNIPIGDLIIQKIRLAGKMQELMMASLQHRSDTALRIGSILLVGSLLCPLLSAWVYFTTDPLTDETIHKIVTLKNQLGELPRDFNVSIGRDWHMLLGGITFGFLCLAAARGFLSQQANAMKTYLELGKKARYFERLSSLTQIILKQNENTNRFEKYAIELMVDKLLYELPIVEDKDGEKIEEESHVSNFISEMTKASQAVRLP